MNEIQQKVKLPAIGLLIAGIINGGFSFLVLAAGILRIFAYYNGLEQLPSDEAERIGFYIGTIGGYGIAMLTLLISPVVIYGAIQMMAGKKHKLSKAAAILAVFPFTSCCMIVGAPMGIWAYIVLNQPDVKAFFNGELQSTRHAPPNPPQF